MNSTRNVLLSVIVAFASLRCNESLPVYNAPANILSAVVSPVNFVSDTVRYRMMDENNPSLVSVRLFSPKFGIDVKIVNIYSETIQDDADIQGTLELTWIDKVEMKASIPLSSSGIIGGQYDPVTHLITLNPGETVTIRVYWDYHFTNTEWAFMHLPYSDGPSYWYGPYQMAFERFHNPLNLHANVKVKVFRSLSFVDAAIKDVIPVFFKGQILSQI